MQAIKTSMQLLKKHGIWIAIAIVAIAIAVWYWIKPKKINPVPGTKLLFIGSSSTADVNSYADQIGNWYPDVEVTKIAQVGATTNWMIDNALTEISSGQYAGIYIFGGLNDVYAGLGASTAIANLQTMVDSGKSAGSIVTLITLQPTDNYSAYTADKGAQVDEINSYILSSNANFVVDLFGMTTFADGSQDTSWFQGDFLHLTYVAQTELANEVIAITFV